MNTHIIYYTTYKNIIIYIGCGLPTRYKHTTSGVSHVYDLNRLHFTDPSNVQTTILRGCISEEEALEVEKELILKFKPSYNSQYLGTQERYSLHKDEIQEYAEEYIPLLPELTIRRTTTTQEKLEQGLVLQVREAIAYYEDPNTDNTLLFKVDPLFSEWLDAGVTISNMRSLNKSRVKINQYALSLKIKGTVEAPKFTIGNFYTAKEIKETLKAYYTKHNIVESAKATSITQWYDVTRTTQDKKEGYKILNIK